MNFYLNNFNYNFNIIYSNKAYAFLESKNKNDFSIFNGLAVYIDFFKFDDRHGFRWNRRDNQNITFNGIIYTNESYIYKIKKSLLKDFKKSLDREKSKIIIDFEFMGLPFNGELPEVTQIKMYNLNNQKTCLINFKHKADKIHEDLHSCIPQGETSFNQNEFLKSLKSIDAYVTDEFWGFTIKTDNQLLEDKGVDLNSYFDIKDLLLLNSDMEFKMAKHGNSMNFCHYYISNNKEDSDLPHDGIEELFFIKELYDFGINNQNQSVLTIFPYGDEFRGIPLKEYCENNRRRADGYRYNNDDLLARSLDYYCNLIDEESGY